MIIPLNGLAETVPAPMTIADLIAHVKEGDPDLIVERNGRYVHARDYETTQLEENDRIEFINPNLGG